MHALLFRAAAAALMGLTALAASAATIDADLLDRGSELAYRKALAPTPESRRLNPETVSRARRIANRLVVSAVNMDAQSKRLNWAVNVVPGATPEIGIFPGGRILVTDGLVDRAGLADEELGAVIAYAFSHSMLRHDASRVVAPAADASADPNRLMLAYADAVSAAMRNLQFTPAEIVAADRASIEMLARAAYDPRSAANAWRRLAASGKGLVERAPVTEERMAALDAAARNSVALYEETRARAEAYARSQRPRAPPRITGQPQRDPFTR
jgi:predicted Zn-dependent protease